ncbi:hypothetical protein Tco_0037274, partial [Tanacetum coccineum]
SVSSLAESSMGEEDLLTREAPSLKNSSYKGPKRRSNSCCDGTDGTRPEVSLATDVSDISLISSNLRCMDSTINRVLLFSPSLVRCLRSGSLLLNSFFFEECMKCLV